MSTITDANPAPPSTPTPGWIEAQASADLTLWLSDTVPMFFRRIPAAPDGFRMGERGGEFSAEPIHRVCIPRPFYLGAFPVTQHQWRAVVNRWPELWLDPEPSFFTDGGDLRPVEQVSWHEADRWCAGVQEQCFNGTLRWTTMSASPVAIDRIVLPSEAHWEHACRGGADTDYWSGDGEAALTQIGWYGGNSGRRTHAVGEMNRPNGWGLHDMHGNVDEWCADVWDPRPYRNPKRVDGWEARVWTAVDAGKEREERPTRVFRGGSWTDRARLCRSARREGLPPDMRADHLGFRCCLLPAPLAKP